jgi:hypothetical protein
MSANDPLAVVRAALDVRDCNPRGPDRQYTALCPAHEDRSASLSVGGGADGRALVYCHRGCTTGEIVAALGLSVSDLFTVEHRNGRPVRGVAKPIPMLDLVLSSLKQLGIDYRASLSPTALWVAEACPVCQDPTRWPLWITEQVNDGDDDHHRPNRRVALSCAGGCRQVDVLNALAVIG